MGKFINVLLVEDNPGDAFLTKEMLEEIPDYNFGFTEAGTLKEAVSLLQVNSFDVVLLDLGLPDSEGLNALETVLDLEISFPVVVITGLDDGATGQKAVEMGAQTYLVKGEFSGFSMFDSILFSIHRSKFLKRIKAQEAELRDKNIELEKSLTAKNLLISIISHDLRGPVNSIISLLDIMDSEYDIIDDSTKKEYLKSILASSKNTRNLMENLLQWANIESKRKQVKPQETEVSALIKESLQPLTGVANEKSIELTVDTPENLKINADKQMVTTVIRNLVSNALKFTPRNGTVKTSAEATAHNGVFICIEDNGVGIGEKTLKTLLEVGETTSSTGTEGETGSGFGLILCKEFIEKNNGELTIESEKEKGTKVCISLPEA